MAEHDKVTDDLIRAKMDKLVNSDMKHGEDSDSQFMEKTVARSELEKMSEPLSPTADLRTYKCKDSRRRTRASK